MRFFTFGCSFTNYDWPTWSDMLLFNNNGYNMGISGTGNETMLYRIMEADRKFKFTENDQIVVMFTTPIRMDIANGTPPRHIGYGQIINVKEIFKYEGELYTIESLCFKSYYSILAIKNYLENKNIKYIFSSITNIYEDVDNYFKIVDISEELKNLITYIKNEVTIDVCSVYDFLKENKYIEEKTWGVTKKWKDEYDYHPRPLQHFKYLTENLLPKLSIDLKITMNEINQFEFEIDSISDKDEYNKHFKEKYPSIINKKMGPEIYF